MGLPQQHSSVDDLVHHYLGSVNDTNMEPILSELVSEHAAPLIEEIVRYKLHTRIGSNTIRAEDAAEVCSEVIIKILNRLRGWKTNPSQKPAGGFMDYVAVTTYHACSQYWRESNPMRNRVKNRLLYLLIHSDEFAIWKIGGNQVCGFHQWKNREDVIESQAVERLLLRGIRAKGKLERLKAVFLELNAPIRFNDLITLMMDIEGVKNTEENLLISHEEENLLPNETQPSIVDELEQREFLKSLWNEIQELSEKQRMALLFSLRDESGGSILHFFPSLGITSVSRLSVLFNMTRDQFGAIWNELPLDDFRISSILGITRQQVINLRKCARERLSRRLKLR